MRDRLAAHQAIENAIDFLDSGGEAACQPVPAGRGNRHLESKIKNIDGNRAALARVAIGQVNRIELHSLGFLVNFYQTSIFRRKKEAAVTTIYRPIRLRLGFLFRVLAVCKAWQGHRPQIE